MKVPVELVARAMYARTVFQDKWETEQANLRLHWINSAEDFVAVMEKAGYEIVYVPVATPAEKPVEKQEAKTKELKGK
jgi:hypothetical protein